MCRWLMRVLTSLVHCAAAEAKRWIGRTAYLEGFGGDIVVAG